MSARGGSVTTTVLMTGLLLLAILSTIDGWGRPATGGRRSPRGEPPPGRVADLRQRVDHAVEVATDGRLGRLGVARAQGLDDLEVLWQRHRRAARVQGQPELVAHV